MELLEPIGSIWNGTIGIWSFIYGHWNPNLGPHFRYWQWKSPLCWLGTGNGRWLIRSTSMSNATRLLIRLQTIRLKWWVCRKYGKGIAYKISMFNTSNHLYWKHVVSIVGWKCNAVAEHEIAPRNPSVFTILGVVCRWFVPLSNNMAGTIGLNESGKWSHSGDIILLMDHSA